MNIKIQLPKVTDLRPRITVIGVGGAGGNAVNNMIASGLSGVNFVVANTDAQALTASSAEHRIQLGVNLTEGLGAGSKPEIGEAAAEEALDEIRSQVSGSHMVFIAAGMGGGTGTGAASVIARIAKDLEILTVGVVTKPFQFEGGRRMRIAEAGVNELKKFVDTLIVIPNQNLFRVANDKTTFAEAFVLADQVLYSGIACIVDLIVKEGLINLDFADVRTIMSGMGTAMMGTGEASGEQRAIIAAEEAISNPLLDDISLRGAKGLLLSIIGGRDLTLYEVDEAASRVRQEVDAEANIIVGATFDDSLDDRVRVSIVASGMSERMELKSQSAEAGAAAPRQNSAPGRQSPNKQPQGGPPPRVPPPPPDDFMRALSNAIGPEPAPRSDKDKPREVWRGPGDVVIEDGLPHLSAAGGPLPPRAPGRNDQQRTSEPFTPAAPIEARGAHRRMPAVEDFPPLAQREYHAKSARNDSGRIEPSAGDSNHDGQPRRRGLFSRLTGLGRNDAPPPPANHHTPHVPWDDRGERESTPLTGVRSRNSDDHPPRSSSTQEEAEYHTFFNRDRRGS